MKEIRFDGADTLTAAFAARHDGVCACRVFSRRQVVFYILLAAGWLLLLKYRWDIFVLLTTLILSFWYFCAAFFRCGAAVLALKGRDDGAVSSGELAALDKEELPVYTILAPLYHEANIAGKLLHAIDQLDYPRKKLDVKLLLEADDTETLEAIRRAGVPDYCEVIIVPDTLPRTKPRACNYGLAAARGEYCVIFDAEDRPDPDQLKKALAVFRRPGSEKLACVQAKLNYFNATYNWLTRFFTVEYSVNFDLMLPGMRRFRLPLPLGGTSNHFRTALLREIGPWDPFNVTEDCDLGLRIYEAGYETGLVDSTTWEEANCRLGNWLRQRSRWVKGFVQTHLAHCRHPRRTLRLLGWRGAFGSYLAVGGSVLMMLTNVIYWGIMLVYGGLLLHAVVHGIPAREMIVGPWSGPEVYQGISIGRFSFQAWPLVYAGATENGFWALLSQVFFVVGAVLLLANIGFVAIGVAACCRRGFYRLIPMALLMPFYWLLISFGAWKGFIQLFTRPFYWEKTRHGLTVEESEVGETIG